MCMNELKVNFDIAADEYTKWNSVFPDEVIERITAAGVVLNQAEVLDLGCGSGVACRMMAKRGANVVGIDPASKLIENAKTIGADESSQIRYIVSSAEQIPLPDQTVDVVTAVRAWHWFDRHRVISEVKRVSKPGGWLVVIDSVFIPSKSPIVKRTIDFIRQLRGGGILAAGSKANTTQFRNGFPVDWFREWEDAGFDLVDEWTFEYSVPFSHEGWRGRVQALSFVISLSAEKKKQLDEYLKGLLDQEFPHHPLVVTHECSGVVLRIHP